MEETKVEDVPSPTISESSDQDTEEKVPEPVTKKAKRVLTEKQKAILTLGREKARANRESKTKAKLDGMLEEYLKQKSEEDQILQETKNSTHNTTSTASTSISCVIVECTRFFVGRRVQFRCKQRFHRTTTTNTCIEKIEELCFSKKTDCIVEF